MSGVRPSIRAGAGKLLGKRAALCDGVFCSSLTVGRGE
ncbi:hypothetical protein FRUB_07220 [Fimbriiglobus ruber]|uniref:Uncharacterized protein n=1 Tax=Fimbriiglobus ruber TaxID=1908690 RepID=A0A225D917_9BACT|nr:hypothetical protein FRUB_07220 [Fimbriiglobus ruber]